MSPRSGAATGQHDCARIVVGLDDSAGGRAALAFALHEAARRGAGVETVSAFEIPGYWEAVHGVSPPPDGPSMAQARNTVREKACRVVEEVSAALSGVLTDLPAVTVTAVGGGAADALLHAARDADLLVVGSRGRGGFAGMLLGSVSMSCVFRATCPVTVVRPAATTVQTA